MPPALRPPTNPPPTTPPIFAFSIFSILLLGVFFLQVTARWRAQLPEEQEPLLQNRGRVRTVRRSSYRHSERAIAKAKAKAKVALEHAVAETADREEMSEPARVATPSVKIPTDLSRNFVERRDSETSIASASTVDSEGPVTPDQEVVMNLGENVAGMKGANSKLNHGLVEVVADDGLEVVNRSVVVV